MASTDDNQALFAIARSWVARHYPGRLARRLTLHLDDGDTVQLPIPISQSLEPSGRASFVPNAYQIAIMEALEGKALRTTALASATGGDQRRLFKPGGLKELQDQGLVEHHARLGYYCPDSPPPEISS